MMNADGMDRRAFVRTAGGLLVMATAGCVSDRVTGVTRAWTSGALSLSDATPLVPNLLNDASFETGWDGFMSFSGGGPVGVTRPLQNGRRVAQFVWSASPRDLGAQFGKRFVPQDRIWVRFEFQISNSVSTIWKFCRMREAGFNTLLGGLFVRRGAQMVTWGFDTELSAQDVNIGISQDRVTDGAWHSMEFDYWRNGDPSGFPSVAVWLDGVPTVGTVPPPAPARWVDGRLNAGERKSSKKVAVMALMGTLNAGNTTNGRCRIDRVSISSVGRIGA